MRKHQFAKVKCNCAQRATYFKCKHCGVVEYGDIAEMRRKEALRAVCSDPGAPMASPKEKFAASMGGTFDCLAPDYDTWDQGSSPDTEPEKHGG